MKRGNNFKSMIGARSGLLEVIADAGTKNGKAVWSCKCDCGNEIAVSGDSLRQGQFSCGCSRPGKKTHGGSDTREYRIWGGMLQRCTNRNNRAFKNYGGRGIEVCERWLYFAAFMADMGPCPTNFTIERKDVDKGYSPENCEWIPAAEQAKNKRNVTRVDGKTLPELEKETGVKYGTLRYRLKAGVDFNKRVGREIMLTHNGLTQSMSEWSKQLGIPRSTISVRYGKGLPPEEILKVKKTWPRSCSLFSD